MGFSSRGIKFGFSIYIDLVVLVDLMFFDDFSGYQVYMGYIGIYLGNIFIYMK